MLNVTGFPDAPPVAYSEIGLTPKVTGEEGAVKLIDCEAGLTVNAVAGDVTDGALPVNDAVIE